MIDASIIHCSFFSLKLKYRFIRPSKISSIGKSTNTAALRKSVIFSFLILFVSSFSGSFEKNFNKYLDLHIHICIYDFCFCSWKRKPFFFSTLSVKDYRIFCETVALHQTASSNGDSWSLLKRAKTVNVGTRYFPPPLFPGNSCFE